MVTWCVAVLSEAREFAGEKESGDLEEDLGRRLMCASVQVFGAMQGFTEAQERAEKEEANRILEERLAVEREEERQRQQVLKTQKEKEEAEEQERERLR